MCEPTAELTHSSDKGLIYYPIFITAEYQALCSSGPGMTSAGTGKELLKSWPTETCAEAVLKPLWVSSYFGTVWPDTPYWPASHGDVRGMPGSPHGRAAVAH